MSVRRGDVCVLDFGQESEASMQKRRPVLVIQNNVANQHSPYTIIVAIRGYKDKQLPVQVKIPKGVGNLDKDSLVDCGHISTILQERLTSSIGKLPANYLAQVDRAIRVSVGLSS